MRKSTTLWIIARSDGGERALAFALDRELFQILARGEESRGASVCAERGSRPRLRAEFEHWPEDSRSEDQQSREEQRGRGKESGERATSARRRAGKR